MAPIKCRALQCNAAQYRCSILYYITACFPGFDILCDPVTIKLWLNTFLLHFASVIAEIPALLLLLLLIAPL